MSHKYFYLKAGLVWMLNIPRRGKREFLLQGKTYTYFDHFYNLTWLNERRVEIPIIMDVLNRNPDARALEVGNVLSHYDHSLKHTVVDKYEDSKRGHYFKEDAETFSSDDQYDIIVSISTLEHVGWDESPRDPGKIFRTIHNLRGLLSAKGALVFTAPVGYSQPLDRLIDEGDGFVERLCLRRVNSINEWEESDWVTVRRSAFHSPYPFANGLVVARIKPC